MTGIINKINIKIEFDFLILSICKIDVWGPDN